MRAFSTTYCISSVATCLEQIDADLAAYFVFRGDSAESVMVRLLTLLGEQGLGLRRSSMREAKEEAY